MSKFKEKDIVVVMDNDKVRKFIRELVPIGMITKITKVITIDNESNYYYLLSNSTPQGTYDINKFRMATDREAFLYHLEGAPFVMEKE